MNAVLTAVWHALGFGTELDAKDNLLGVQVDLEQAKEKDVVAINTVTRVVHQLGEARRLLEKEEE